MADAMLKARGPVGLTAAPNVGYVGNFGHTHVYTFDVMTLAFRCACGAEKPFPA